ncbi:MAG TPA: class I SAM-dependent methyltransferase [Bradyrhizobium sp.]|nr:class I SAM-dependent methyltransferase [Bradyrhizobium sp.]
MWRHFINTIPEHDLSTREVLDFGCNRGGFLRLLHALKPYRRALGVDIAEASIAAARDLGATIPVEFLATSDLSRWPDRFDVAFSYEVIYLLPDLDGHAEMIKQSLRSGGVYYAVTGCHTASPLWPHWKDLIGGSTNAPVQDRSPEEYAEVFARAGFDVSVRRFGYDGFTAAHKDRKYYPTLLDAVDYPAVHKLLFRLVKTG